VGARVGDVCVGVWVSCVECGCAVCAETCDVLD
jgi:hypothetical protein